MINILILPCLLFLTLFILSKVSYLVIGETATIYIIYILSLIILPESRVDQEMSESLWILPEKLRSVEI